MSDLTYISTFGWYSSLTTLEDLTPISTFGWYFTISPSNFDDNSDIISLTLYLNKNISFELER